MQPLHDPSHSAFSLFCVCVCHSINENGNVIHMYIQLLQLVKFWRFSWLRYTTPTSLNYWRVVALLVTVTLLVINCVHSYRENVIRRENIAIRRAKGRIKKRCLCIHRHWSGLVQTAKHELVHLVPSVAYRYKKIERHLDLWYKTQEVGYVNVVSFRDWREAEDVRSNTKKPCSRLNAIMWLGCTFILKSFSVVREEITLTWVHVPPLCAGSSNLTRDGSVVRKCRVADRSGSIIFSLWNEEAEVIEPGDIIKLTKG